MTMERDEDAGWRIRPRDLGFDITQLRFEPLGFIGPLPRLIRVTNAFNRSCMYLAVRTIIYEPLVQWEGRWLDFIPLDLGWELMPPAIVAKDGVGNSCRYEPRDPRLAKK